MGAPERVVRQLRLRADSEASVRRGLLVLQDAMRCASLPDAGERVLLVRRLDLGLIASHATSQTLSRLLEQKVAAAGGIWVHAIDPAAEHANFVFFRDALEARCELALRLARSETCSAWYWLLAVPEFKPAEGAHTNLRRIALGIAALPEARAALPAWIARLTAGKVASAVVRAFEAADVPVLLRAAQLSAAMSHKAATVSLSQLRLAASVDSARASRVAPADEARPSGERMPIVATSNTALPSWWHALADAGGYRTDIRMGPPAVTPAQAGSDAERVGRASARHPQAEALLPDNRQVIESSFAPACSDPGVQLACTGFGGLLFLLPVLQRLGFAAWAENLHANAAEAVVRQMLGQTLQRLRAPPGDSSWLLARARLNEGLDVIDAEAPTLWGASALASARGSAAVDLVVAAGQPQSAATLARLWLATCRRWLRRQARIGIANLVCRPAAFDLTPTHADVHFRLSEADMRIRRAALDVDPGWVWWYGRVIHFHYAQQWPAFTDTPSERRSDGS